jgi:hypothetical protein
MLSDFRHPGLMPIVSDNSHPRWSVLCRRASFAGLMTLVVSAPVIEAQRQPHAETSTARPTRFGARACDTSWSALRELQTRAGQRVYIEAPVRVEGADGTYLVGAPTFVWADRAAFTNETSSRGIAAVGVKRLEGSLASPLPELPSARAPFMPVAARLASSLLTLWATSPDTSPGAVFNLDTLWEARLIAGRWTRPRPVWSAGRLVWRPGAASVITVDSSVIVAFPATDTTRSPSQGVVVMSSSGSGWHSRWIAVGSAGPAALAAMAVSPSALIIAVVGSINRPPLKALNAVYTVGIRLDDTRSEPKFTLIRELLRGHPEDPNVFRTSDGLHVAWRHSGRRMLAHDSLVEAISRDGGATWVTAPATSLEGDMRGMRVLPLTGRDAVAMALDIGTAKILTLRRGRATWTMTSEEFSNAKTTPMITTTNNRMTVSFGQTRSSTGPDGTYEAPVLVTASRALRCETTSATTSPKRLRAPPRGQSTPR